MRAWQGDVLDLVRSEGGSRRTDARIAAYGINGVGMFLMLVVFTHTAGPRARRSASPVARRCSRSASEAIFGDQAVRTMAAKARSAQARTDALMDAEARRYAEAIGTVHVPGPGRPTLPRLTGCRRPMSPFTLGAVGLRGGDRGVPARCAAALEDALSAGVRNCRTRRWPCPRGVDQGDERGPAYRRPHRGRPRRRDGSGKSSLFNAVVGGNVATIGARRPTTSRPPLPCGDQRPPVTCSTGRGRVATSGHDRAGHSLDGLVLLDLPRLRLS